MNTAKTEAAAKAIPYPSGMPKEDRPAAMTEYRKAVAEVERKFKEWLADTYASSLPTEVQNLIWAKAWEAGHAYGYFDVESHYIDLAEFAEAVAEWYR